MRAWFTALAVVAVLAASIVSFCWPPLDASGPPEAPRREIVLVARGMAFYFPDDLNTPNPTIRVRAGERVRLVLRNEEPGITHGFAVPAWGVETRLLESAGSDTIELPVPGVPGRQDYRCTPHAAMMRGTIEVR